MAGVMVRNKSNSIQAWESYYWTQGGHCIIAETDLSRCMKLPFFDHEYHQAQLTAQEAQPEPEVEAAAVQEPDGEASDEGSEGAEAAEESADADSKQLLKSPPVSPRKMS